MPPEAKSSVYGKVLLVGAGPGPADLLTLRAARAIGQADAVLYDALVSAEVLDLAPPRCLRVQTGKRAGKTSMPQATINRLMLRLARRGLTVVRLKGGDPAVFGRVGEEKAFLQAYGIDVEIVPGITAASAAAAQFGFPLTHRGEARRLLVSTGTVTANTGEGGPALDQGWAAAADPETTLALYMGREQIAGVADRLIALGRAPSTPAIAIENAGAPHARAIAAPLCELPAALAAAAPSGPVVILVGEVTAYAEVALNLPRSLQGARA